MTESRVVTIRVPASTANLGPGFDCLGLALDIWNETTFILSGNSISIEIIGEGQGLLSLNQSNIIYRSFYETLEKHNQTIPSGLLITCNNKIPVSSGLGSSASAVIAGILAANSLFNLDLSKVDIFNLALQYEGHGDNLAASLEGGLVLVFPSESGFRFKKLNTPSMQAIVCIPEIQLSTQIARKSLPETYTTGDAVFNICHTALLLHAFCTEDFTLLKPAMQDRVHQPYRFPLIPGAEKAVEAAYDMGALGVALSGAGPGLIAFYEDHESFITESMRAAFQRENINSKVLITRTCSKSAYAVSKQVD